MTIELTDQRRLQLDDGNGTVRLIDPESKQSYVLVRAEVFDRWRGLLEEEFQPSEAYPAIDVAFAEGWNDPAMDVYDHYEEYKK